MLDLYYTDPAQHLMTAGYDLDDRDRDLCVRCVNTLPFPLATPMVNGVDGIEGGRLGSDGAKRLR